ncbi:hypothetical protein CerSpe_245120 [Prunus speciosa]
MTHLHKLRTASVLKWVSSNFDENHLRSARTPIQLIGYFPNGQTPRFYKTERSPVTESCENVDRTSTGNGKISGRISRAVKKEAQDALLDYLYCTRSLHFVDAENMSKNTPHFLKKLIKSADNGKKIGQTIARFLRYHPINEFEPFFESLGLKPPEYVPLLPHKLMFLIDDDLLLHNYGVLCHYGIARNKIGKIYKEATEVFQYHVGVLLSKLQAYEELGLSQSALIKFVVASPYLLIGDANASFLKLLGKLKSLGFEISWIQRNLSEENSYNWSRMLEALSFLSKMGCSDRQLGELIGQHPDILFEASGERTFSIIGFLLKFGSRMSQVYSLFLQFPRIQVMKFGLNLRKCFFFLNEIGMEVPGIGKIIRSHPLLLGSCALKKTNTLLLHLNIGKKSLCRYIQENPQELKHWVLGRRLRSLDWGNNLRSKTEKAKFLLDIGFVENSNKMKEVLNEFQGNGWELQERFDCIVEAGFDHEEVCQMVKASPRILSQSKDVIEMKIDFLVNHLCYPSSTLLIFPKYLTYGTKRVQHRVLMYNWLKDHGTDPTYALSTVVSCSDVYFLRKFVNHHPSGPQVWEDLKSKIYSKQ